MNRRSPRVRSLVAGAALSALVLAVAGCGTDSATDAPTAEKRQQLFDEQCAGTVIPDLPDLEPIPAEEGTGQVETEFGTVELPTHPKAALGMYTTDVDMLIWLRYPLAGSQPIRGDGYKTFPCFFPYDPLDGVSTFANYPDYDYESILLAEPDFILNGLGYDKKVVKRLPEIAPTYSVDAFDGESWMTHFEDTARALGRSEYYDAWKKIYDERVAEVRAAIGDVSDVVVSPVGYWDGKIQTGCYSGVECQVFDDLGLTINAASLVNDREGEALSAEQFGQLGDVDYGFMIKGLGEEGQQEYDKTLAELQKNALWGDLGFVQESQIVTYEWEMTYGSPSGQLAFLDVVEKALAT
ncbi:ABC transporter substrate-binding protein [Nocardioides humi]|uniref:Fe/B12 periplasmic-binding domain-containing protein n=1 Tax=Nocardioides humi TaxID=449461 RepID=A0ABN2BRQ0_9ACTN|nr:ABC transporter substrate-binding protein [Nocardioides humi]